MTVFFEGKPKTEFVTRVEGGEWIPFEEFTEIRPRRRYDNWVHSIKFEDGSIWDAVNGWRQKKPRYCYNWKTAEWDLMKTTLMDFIRSHD